MEPPSGIWASVLQFLRFLPFFVGLLLLGIIKGLLLCPLVCLLMTVGISAITLGLWPAHFCWTFYCVVRAKQVGPVLKLVLCPSIFIVLILWPVVSIISSIVGGAAYGFLSPVFATFDAVGEGKTDDFYHSIYDGTWSTVQGCFTVIRDFRDVCFHSYFSIMDDLRQRGPPDAKYYEIRILYLPGAIIAGVFGLLIDFPVITLLAIFKSPYMLFKGWRRLIQDLIGREGPFLETICVPFAGLAIILWPLAVVGAVLGSMVSSVGLGAYAGVVAYQESSLLMGLHYVAAALAIYDEYSNDIIDMPEGSCFPRPHYRKKDASQTPTSAPTLSRPNSFQKNLSRKGSLKSSMVELKPLELLDSIFKECHHQGDLLVTAGAISMKDVEDSKSGKDKHGVISIDDNITEITSTNRPKEAFFDWFFNPLLILKDQIKAENLSPSEEEYLGNLILLGGDSQRFRNSCTGNAPADELKKAELEALARRLRGITTSITRFPTFRRRFEFLTKSILENLTKKSGGSHSGNGSGTGSVSKSRNGIVRFLSERSFKRNQSDNDSESLSHIPIEKDLEIQ
ncbi:hypothetical protein KSS87_018132 [Heliosperma pusillum]|nr:hypothetical protein KSS87_018132 [Heliosperma pusillum]